jgi:ammonia channel protein AmtB
MQTVRKLTCSLLAVLMIAPSSAFANGQHVVDQGMIAAAIAQHVAEQDNDRAAIHEALARPQVQELAGRMGLDISRATAAIDTMTGADLERAAAAARQVNQQLVGGASTVVISTTTIIIVLLLVILLVVALR